MKVLAGALLLMAVTPLTAAQAQEVCADRELLLRSLADDYSERPTAVGLADNGSIIEVLAARDGRTWTILMTLPDGISCVVATGEQWEDLPYQVAGSDV